MAGPDRPSAHDGLLADVVVMSRQAAEDGLPLAAVFEDLRLVLDLEPADDVPADVLRVCAITWAETQQRLSTSLTSRPAAGTAGDLENHVWHLLADGDGPVPDTVLVVRLLGSDVPLHGPELLLAAAHDLHAVFRLPGERVTRLATPESAQPDRVVVLTHAQHDPLARARSAARGLTVDLHELGQASDGTLAELRRVLSGP